MDVAELSDLPWKSKQHPGRTHGFFQRSVFVKHLDYWHPWMMNFRDLDHMILNRVRGIILALKGQGNMRMDPNRMLFELSLGDRFTECSPVTHTRDGKTITHWPDRPWQASKEEIHFVDEVLPELVRLPQV